RLRRMRVITTFEGIRERWSRGNEQFFTWVQLPIGVLLAGIALNGLGVVLAAVFGLNIQLTMLAAGLVVIFVAAFGGAWAATARGSAVPCSPSCALLSGRCSGSFLPWWDGF